MSDWVVVKFGGTSVSTPERWDVIADIVRARANEGLRPLLVCSAFSGVSNALEDVLDAAVQGNHKPALDTLVARHQEVAASLGVSADIVANELSLLEQLVLGVSLVGEASARVHARVMALGELMSTRLGVARLQEQGLDAQWVDARTCLHSDTPRRASEHRRFLSATCHHESDESLQATLGEITSRVLVTQGFIASDEDGHTVLLGRGGSDTSAAYFAARLGATRCEIWTDVPGMFTANPRDIVAARLLRKLDYAEAQELATAGAKVLHPRCIAPVRQHRIPLHIRCTPHPEQPGTVISDDTTNIAQVKAVSAKDNITLVSMDTLGMWQQVGFLASVFQVFAAHGLSIDLVSTSEANVTVTLDPGANALGASVLTALVEDLSSYCRARIVENCAAISLVGRKIRGIFHELGPALEVFEEQRIHLVSQAASDLNVTFVVDQSQAHRLVKRLHVLLFENRAQSTVFGSSWEELFDSGEGIPAIDTDKWWVARRDELQTLATTQGPCFVYDADTLDQKAKSLLDLQPVNQVLYAIKANNNPHVLRRFYNAGLGFECVSPGELDHVFGLFPDIDPARVLFTPNFAPRDEYADALERGVHLNIDNVFALEQWADLFAGREVFVRIDPGRGKGHHHYVRTAGKQSKFGVAPEELDALVSLVATHDIRVVGLHVHAGSGVRSPEQWANMALFLAGVARNHFPAVKTLNVGGGLGVPEKPGQAPLDLVAVSQSLAEFRTAHPGYDIWIEPGRYLVAEAGVLLSPVTQTKQKADIHYVGLRTGMNSLIRPALYGAFHDIVNLTRLEAPRTLVANIVGPICETGDTLGYSRRMPETQAGDVVLVDTVGAYGRTMSSRYNLREPAAEVLLAPLE